MPLAGLVQKSDRPLPGRPVATGTQARPQSLSLYGPAVPAAQADDVVVCGDATACIVTFQVAKIKRGQRLFSNSGGASMGYDLPAASARRWPARQARRLPGRRRQPANEPARAADSGHPAAGQAVRAQQWRLPVDPQHAGEFFGGRMIGESPESGVSFPDVVKLAGLTACRPLRIDGSADLRRVIARYWKAPGRPSARWCSTGPRDSSRSSVPSGCRTGGWSRLPLGGHVSVSAARNCGPTCLLQEES